MLFNSIAFAIYLPIVFLLYWFVLNKSLRTQNLFLLVSGFVFYGWWDWRFLLLLVGMAVSNYFIGISIESSETERKSKSWLIIGLVVNIGVLCIFKYFNFFIESFIDFIYLFGYNLPHSSTRIVLPVGISFYTFLSISYIIDIHKKNLHANRNAVEVLLSLSFFPIILAGPIQRPSTLLPQIANKRVFEYDRAVDGMKQILWGLFKKVVIADNCAEFANQIFNNSAAYSGSTLLLGAVFFAIQLYGDFSGYSDIAIGTARLFGFNLMRNFAYPYFSRDIAAFWQRWHISLTTWFRDYVFLPLSFAISYRMTKERILFMKSDLFIYIVASILTWFLTGLWHGANYTYIIWGMIHGLFLILYQWQKKPRKKLLKRIGLNNDNPFVVLTETFITLAIVAVAWIFFRANSIEHAFKYISEIFSSSLFTFPQFHGGINAYIALLFSGIAILIEWFGKEHDHPIAGIGSNWPKTVRWAFYYTIAMSIFLFAGKEQQFIYFQF